METPEWQNTEWFPFRDVRAQWEVDLRRPDNESMTPGERERANLARGCAGLIFCFKRASARDREAAYLGLTLGMFAERYRAKLVRAAAARSKLDPEALHAAVKQLQNAGNSLTQAADIVGRSCSVTGRRVRQILQDGKAGKSSRKK